LFHAQESLRDPSVPIGIVRSTTIVIKNALFLTCVPPFLMVGYASKGDYKADARTQACPKRPTAR